jgi:DNA topoisomerase-1
MNRNLVIVESPAKAKTIEKYLGKDFQVLSSIGHIRSIPKKTKNNKPPIDVANNFETQYEVDSDKKKTIAELKRAVKNSDKVWLATDEDREGEAIAWHLCEVLKLDPKTTNRIVFHEITKTAIEEAIKHPRTIDMDLVRAQQARQILDRLVGFELSPVVWKKVPGGKSAGRVQSPAVRLLVEKESEINKFQKASSFKLTATFFDKEKNHIEAEAPKKIETEELAKKALDDLKDKSFKVKDISKSITSRNPAAPFTTSTLQQEANAKLNFSSKATMASAQRLYQSGKITYMRTDSVNLSSQAIDAVKDYLMSTFGEKYINVRHYKTTSANAQEAHEAIRPTSVETEKASSNAYDQKLYDLIRRRTIASQMSSAKIERTSLVVESNTSDIFEAKYENVVFDGFLSIYGNKKSNEDIPKIEKNDLLTLDSAQAKQVFSRPPARYTEGSLVKKMEELGIGRPSTYATIIGTILDREYAVKGDSEGTPREVIILSMKDNNISREVTEEKTGSDKGKLIPTPRGELITDFLTNYFDNIVDYGFTAKTEKNLDMISNAKEDRNKMLSEFYGPFHKQIEASDSIDRTNVTKVRVVGKDKKTGFSIIARYGKFGPVLQLGSQEETESPQFAPIPKNSRIDSITVEEAEHAFELPRAVGKTPDGVDIITNIGRFGPYIKVGSKFISIKGFDPRTITLEESLNAYSEKMEAEAKKIIATFKNNISILNGRFGPYITNGDKNVKIPKDTDPKNITEEKAIELLSAKQTTKTRRRTFKRKK